MDMLHQTITWRKKKKKKKPLDLNLIIEIQMSTYLLQTFKSPGRKLIMHNRSLFVDLK